MSSFGISIQMTMIEYIMSAWSIQFRSNLWKKSYEKKRSSKEFTKLDTYQNMNRKNTFKKFIIYNLVGSHSNNHETLKTKLMTLLSHLEFTTVEISLHKIFIIVFFFFLFWCVFYPRKCSDFFRFYFPVIVIFLTIIIARNGQGIPL